MQRHARERRALHVYALQSVEAMRYAQNDTVYPIVRMDKNRVAPRSDGVVSGRSIEVCYAFVLRAELILVGRHPRPTGKGLKTSIAPPRGRAPFRDA